ncbi:MAG TPA: hypothetical protein VF403_16910 [Kofleriaceae bacterium]
MKRWPAVAIGAALVAIVLLGSYLMHHTEPRPPMVADDPPPPPMPKAAAPQPIARIDHAQKLATKAERQQLADQIASAQTARKAAAHAPRPPVLPVVATIDPTRPDDMKTTIRTAMRDAIPLITDCYQQAMPQLADAETRIAAKLTLTSDPDVGTIIDAHQISDDQGRPLLATFDDCLRDTIQQLALPPIADGGTIEVTYPLTFHK